MLTRLRLAPPYNVSLPPPEPHRGREQLKGVGCCSSRARQVALTAIMKVANPSCMQEHAMSRHHGLSEWTELVSTHMPHLSVPQARVLALWSYGIALTRSCGRLTVATFLALLLGQKVATVEQRLY